MTAAISGIAHLLIGITIHTSNWNLLDQFVRRTDNSILPFMPRIELHGIANYAGLLQAIILVILIILSMNWAIRYFGILRWKWLQRLTYLSLLSIVIHASMYQIIEERSLILRMIFFLFIAFIVLIQSIGIILHFRSERVQ